MAIDPHQFTSPAAARAFVLAGNATLTIVSLKTGARFTFKIKKGKKRENDPHFVSVRDEDGFSYLGTIFADGVFKTTRRSHYDSGQPCARAFRFFMEALAKDEFHPQLEVWHEGTCGKCGRKLTVPESIATGLGPECAAVAGVPRVKRPRKKTAKKTAPAEAEDIEREMHRMEAEADAIQTHRENLNKMFARASMET